MKRFYIFFIFLFSIFVNTIYVYSASNSPTIPIPNSVDDLKKSYNSIYNSYKDVVIKNHDRKFIREFINIISEVIDINISYKNVSDNNNKEENITYVTFEDIYKSMDWIPRNRLYYTVIFIYLYDNFPIVYNLYLKSLQMYSKRYIYEYINLNLLKYYKYINDNEYNTYVALLYKYPKPVIDKKDAFETMVNTKEYLKHTLDSVYFEDNIPVDVYINSYDFFSNTYKLKEHYFINNNNTVYIDFQSMISIDHDKKIINVYYK